MDPEDYYKQFGLTVVYQNQEADYVQVRDAQGRLHIKPVPRIFEEREVSSVEKDHTYSKRERITRVEIPALSV